MGQQKGTYSAHVFRPVISDDKRILRGYYKILSGVKSDSFVNLHAMMCQTCRATLSSDDKRILRGYYAYENEFQTKNCKA